MDVDAAPLMPPPSAHALPRVVTRKRGSSEGVGVLVGTGSGSSNGAADVPEVKCARLNKDDNSTGNTRFLIRDGRACSTYGSHDAPDAACKLNFARSLTFFGSQA